MLKALFAIFAEEVLEYASLFYTNSNPVAVLGFIVVTSHQFHHSVKLCLINVSVHPSNKSDEAFQPCLANQDLRNGFQSTN